MWTQRIEVRLAGGQVVLQKCQEERGKPPQNSRARCSQHGHQNRECVRVLVSRNLKLSEPTLRGIARNRIDQGQQGSSGPHGSSTSQVSRGELAEIQEQRSVVYLFFPRNRQKQYITNEPKFLKRYYLKMQVTNGDIRTENSEICTSINEICASKYLRSHFML